MKETSFSKRQNYWRTIIAEQKGSGLSIKDFCKVRGLASSTFASWSKQLREPEATSKPEQAFAKVIDPKEVGVAARVPLKIEFKNGTCLHLAVTPEAEWLASILKLIA